MYCRRLQILARRWRSLALHQFLARGRRYLFRGRLWTAFGFRFQRRFHRRGLLELGVIRRHRIANVLHALGIDSRDLLQLLRRHAAQLVDGADAALSQTGG